MSQHQPPHWDQAAYDPSHPYYRPPRRGIGPVVIVLLVLGVLGVLFIGAVVAMVAVVARMEADAPQGYGDHEDAGPPHVHDWAAVRTAYNPDAPRPGDRQLARLQKLADEFARCGNEQDDAALRKIVDYPRFYEEMKKSRFGGDVRLFDRGSLLNRLVEAVRGIEGWQRIAIVDIQPLAEPGELIVYGHGVQADGYANPVRLWVADGRTPKLYDWELIDHGVRETGDWAIICAYDGDPRMEDYRQGLQQSEEADELWAVGEVHEAEQILRAAEQRRVPPPHRDSYFLSLTYKWLGWGRYDQVLALVGRVKDKDAVPGIHLSQAQAVQERGDLAGALDAIARYEAVIGETIESLRLKAEICQRLSQRDEAARHRRSLLQYTPDDVDAIQAWASELPEDDMPQVAAHVATLEDPIATATELAGRLSYRDDAEGVRALADLVEHRLPGSASAMHLAALVHYAGDEFQEAAPLFLKVYQKTGDDKERETARYRYLECMLISDQPLTAYKQSDRPAEDFLYFAEDYEYGDGNLSAEQMRQLAAAHLQRVPDDPWGYYYASYVEDDEETLVRRGLDVAKQADDEEAAEALRNRLLFVMFDAGRAAQAYEANSPSEETFRQLAGYFRYDPSRPVAELDALLDAHQAAHPEDPRIPLYRAISAERQGDADLADTRLALTYRNTSDADEDQSLRNEIREVWIELRTRAGRELDAYRDIPPAEETFASLAGSLYASSNWDKLEMLIAAHERRHGDDPQLLIRQAQLAEGREQHDAVIQRLHPWPARADELEHWEQTQLRELLMSALLAEDRMDDARELAERMRSADGNVRPLVKVCVLSGDVEEAKRLMKELRWSFYVLNGLYEDTEIQDELFGDAYADVRREAPPGLGYGGYGSAPVILLQAKPGAITAEQLRLAAGEVLAGDVRVDALPPDASLDEGGGFVVAGEEARIVVWQGVGKYQADADLAEQDVTDADSLDRCRRHQGWTALHVLQPGDMEEAAYLSHRLAARLMDDNALAVHTPGWLLPAGEEVRLRLTSGEMITDEDELGTAAWLYRDPVVSDEDEKWQKERPARLRDLERAFAARQPGEQFHLQITLTAGHAMERHWLKLVRVEHSGYRDRSFVGQFTAASLLQPRYQPGEHLHVVGYEINNWRIIDGDKTTLARP